MAAELGLARICFAIVSGRHRRRAAVPGLPKAEVAMPASHHAVTLIYPGFLAVTFHELESIMMPFGR